LAAPTPAGSSLSLDLAINLGSSSSDQSCQTSHPASVGAAKPWLRAQNGSCTASADRDPSARASFGLYSPESRKTVHARDIF
jgi:MSHA biogenesis protein MshQ